MSRLSFIVGLLVCGLLAGIARADTYKLANGQDLVGEILSSSANDQGVQVKIGEGEYKQVPWASFSQDDLKRFLRNPKFEPFVEPLIEVSPQEKRQRTEVTLKQPPRLEHPAKGSLPGALFSSGLGVLVLLLLYAANIYAGFEIAIFRAQPLGLVCGAAAVLPIIGPVIFLSMPRRLQPSAEVMPGPGGAPEGAPAGTLAAAGAAAATAGAAEDDLNPMRADGATHPTALKLAHSGSEQKASLPPATTFQRGQFTFNRRFFETKFAGFFSVVRRDADKDMVLVVKAARGEYVAQRISRIAANDLHLLVQRGPASEEVMVPFQEIQQIQLRHKDAK